MKKLISVIVICLAFFVGCSKDLSINNSIADQSTDEFVSRKDLGGVRLEKSFTVSNEINGSLGGLLYTGDQYLTQSGAPGSIYAACIFLPGSFSGTKQITMTVDDQSLTGTFSPGMVFNKPVSFSVLFSGVNLSNLNQSQLAFVYYGADGRKYQISSSFIYFDKVNGVLGILNAQLPHFSRYGFIRKSTVQNLKDISS